MLRKLRRRLTYANVMATIAVVVAVGGGTFAIGAIPDNKGRIKACYVKHGAKKGDVRLLVTGNRCRFNEKKVTWYQHGPRAYARVYPGCSGPVGNKTCLFTESAGITAVVEDDVGIYCITAPGIKPIKTPAVVSVDWDLTPLPVGNASAAVTGQCSGDRFAVRTDRQNAVNVRNEADTGSTSVAGNATAADDVGFTIMIP